MNPQQKILVQQSFARILPMADLVALLFYQRLFELDPSLRILFKGDMPAQGRKLMSTLKVAVSNLDRVAEITPLLQQLGRRHAEYGVTTSHYDTVAEALLWTLSQGLGDDFTPEMEAAWATVYNLLAGVMKEAVEVPGEKVVLLKAT